MRGRGAFEPIAAERANGVYIIVESLALLLLLFEILVGYAAMSISSFFPTAFLSQTNTFNIFSTSLLDLVAANTASQAIGWAYQAWSLLLAVGIVRRERQRFVRRLERCRVRYEESGEGKSGGGGAAARFSSSAAAVFPARRRSRRFSAASKKSDDNSQSSDGRSSPDRSVATAGILRRHSSAERGGGPALIEEEPERRRTRVVGNNGSTRSSSFNSSTSRSSSPPSSCSSRPRLLLNALHVHNSHRLIFFSLLLLIALAIFPVLLDNPATLQTASTRRLHGINVGFPLASDCPDFESSVQAWYAASYYPPAVPKSFPYGTSDNRDPPNEISFLMLANVLPVRCAFQLGVYGTIISSACPGSDVALIDSQAGCTAAVVPTLDALISQEDSNGVVQYIGSGNSAQQSNVRASVVKVGECSGGTDFDCSAAALRNVLVDAIAGGGFATSVYYNFR